VQHVVLSHQNDPAGINGKIKDTAAAPMRTSKKRSSRRTRQNIRRLSSQLFGAGVLRAIAATILNAGLRHHHASISHQPGRLAGDTNIIAAGNGATC
jgi:hypothetical protein